MEIQECVKQEVVKERKVTMMKNYHFLDGKQS